MRTQSTNSHAGRKSRADQWKPPYSGFPLSFHPPSGRLYKKIRGKRHYFGYAKDWQSALEKYDRDSDFLYRGEEPPIEVDSLSLGDLCNRFLTAKQRLLEAGEIGRRTFSEYHQACERMIDHFRKQQPVSLLDSDQFGAYRAVLAKTRGPVALGNEIQRVRSVFKFGVDEGLIQPVKFGQSFQKPSRKVLRIQKAQSGPKMFEPDEIKKLLNSASQPLKACILLAINCGFGAADLSSLPQSTVDLENGWVTFPRPKTGIPRRAKLWKASVMSLREYARIRPKAQDELDADCFLLTKSGQRLVRQTKSNKPNKMANRTDSIANAFKRLVKSLEIKEGRGFYCLRHSFLTAAEQQCTDLVAIRYVMGHADPSVTAHYRERIDDARLEQVASAVHGWLFDEQG
ncbi:MAG: site-specific integrase [Planctomycetaceae bacterium]|nr:site-specific integrase [Planctomycetaceae bacterium]